MKKKVPSSEIEAKQEYLSPLYPEKPSEQARAVALRPEFQKAILYRLRQAMYGNRGIPKVLISMLPVKLPAFEEYVNLEVFTEEEAIEIDRFIRSYLQSRNPSSDDIYSVIHTLLENGELRPAPDEQIDREEKWRRHLLAFAVAFRQRDFERTEELVRELSNATKEKDSEMVADYFRGIIIPLFDSAIQASLVKNDFPSIFRTLHIASLCAFIPSLQFAPTTEFIMKDPAARAILGREFLYHLSTPRYDALMHEWEEMGISKASLHAIIYPTIPDYMGERQKEKGEKFNFADELSALRKRGLITDEEYRSEGQHLVIQGLVDSIGNRADWVKFFSDAEKSATKKDFCSPEELRANPAIRKAAEMYLVKSFGDGILLYIFHRRSAIDEVVLAKIMTREEINTLPSLLSMAASFLEKIFTENIPAVDASQKEKKYINTVQKYVEVGLGTRTYFDNVPAIKKARAEAEQRINKKDS